MQKAVKGLYFTCIFMISAFSSFAQEAGLPFIRNYPPHEYRASPQNWAITQDRNGVMYFGNNDGLLEYDGVSWRLLKLPGVRALALDSVSGRLYAGLENDLGYIEPDSSGNYKFNSLKDLIPEIDREVTTIFTVFLFDGAAVFSSDSKIFHYKDGKIKVYRTNNYFHLAFKVNEHYYVRENGKGLLSLENDSLVLVEDSELFAKERIDAMLPYGQDDILVATRDFGVLIYSPKRQVKFYKKGDTFKKVDDYLIKNRGYNGIILPNGDYAIGTSTGGIIVFNAKGSIVSMYTKQTGLQDNTLFTLFLDRNGQIWAGMDNGISLIQNNLPFRKFNELNGLHGSPICIIFFKGRLYVGTSQYLHVQNDSGNFDIIEGTVGQNFQMFEVGGRLLLARGSGVKEIKGTIAVDLGIDYNALSITSLKNNPSHLIVGAGNGLYLMEYQSLNWKAKWHIKGFDKPCYAVVEDKHGTFWVSTVVDLYGVKVNKSIDSVVSWKQYSVNDGLPSNYGSPFMLNSGEVIFGTERGIYRYNVSKDSFEAHLDFSMLSGKITIFNQEKNGNIWFDEMLGNGNYERGILEYNQGKYVQYRTPLYKFTDLSSGESRSNICLGPDGSLYLGTPSGLLQYNPLKKVNLGRSFNTLIRKVYSNDSLIFFGRKTTGSNNIDVIEIPFSNNDLVFHFSAISYEDSEKNLYSYRLIGYDTTWSKWVNDHKKEYTNLHEGEYIFEVKSRNQFQAIGTTASYSFTILPPWYREWWAYLGYLLILGSIIFILVHLRTSKFKARSRVLERMVKARTYEIQEQKNNVEQLSRIGRDITSSLSIENIIRTVYQNVNYLMDASVFTIGLHNPEQNSLDFPAAVEKNKLLPGFCIPLNDQNRLAVWCFNNCKEVIINDYARDFSKYVGAMTPPIAGESPESILYLPLWNKEKTIGVISAQSFNKNAYTDYHLNMLRNLATYCAIALENAEAYRHLALLFDDLKAAQDRLVTQSKLAALGEITAGIAHEIQNPLNFVNNFSEVSGELLDEMKDELSNSNSREAMAIADRVKLNLEKIAHHGKRADAIVKGMLQHSQSRSGIKEPTDINALADEFLRLSYHGLRAKDKSFNATMNTDFDNTIGKIIVAPQDIGRAILNLLTNSFYSVTQKKKLVDPSNTNRYEPAVSISTKKNGNTVEIKVSDNGTGIPKNVMDKIFQPFFTTKPTGEGTGLGLSLSYDIITKGHGGELKVETVEGEGSTFYIQLPVQKA